MLGILLDEPLSPVTRPEHPQHPPAADENSENTPMTRPGPGWGSPLPLITHVNLNPAALPAGPAGTRPRRHDDRPDRSLCWIPFASLTDEPARVRRDLDTTGGRQITAHQCHHRGTLGPKP